MFFTYFYKLKLPLKNFYFYTASCLIICLLCTASGTLAQKRKKQDEEAWLHERILREAESSFTEAEKYFILEDYAKALLFYQKTLELTPDNATVHFKMADLFNRGTQTTDLQKAAASIEKALELEKKNKYFYLLAANIYSGLQDYDKAIKAYEDMLKEIPGTEDYYFELAALYQYNAKPEQALKIYNKAEQALGLNEVGIYQKVKILLSLKRTEEAKAEAAKLIATDLQEGIFVINLAETFAEAEENQYAITLLENALKENSSESAQVQLLLANLYTKTGNHNQAITLWEKLFSNAEVPFETKAYLLATLTDEISYNPQSAESENKKKLFNNLLIQVEKDHPQEAKVFVLKADFFMITGNIPQAIQAYEQALNMGEETAEVFQNVLLLHARNNNFTQLITQSDKALELYPNQGIFYYYAGYGNFMKKNYTQAIVALEQAKKLSSQNPTFLQDIGALLGDAYQYTRDYAKSEKAYDEVLALNPDNESVLNNYAYYLSLRKANLEKAETMAKRLNEIVINNPTYLDTYAWVLYMKQQYRDAKKIMDKVINSGKANATHLEHYGDILFKLGQTNEAVSYWEKAKAINTTSETLSKKIANKTLYDQ